MSARIFSTLSTTLPDDRPITAIQIIESVDRCPAGFFPINKTHDQDQDADLWREGAFLKRKSCRYLCLSKSEGLPGCVVQEIIILSEKAPPPEGYSLLAQTVDSGQKAWRKKQLCYRIVPKKQTHQAVTDIIVCSRLKKAPEGFTLAGEINGVTICYKMGNVQDSDASPNGLGGQNGVGRAPERPPRLNYPQPVYPNLDGGDNDYEILNPAATPTRPAPRPPQQTPGHLQHTLSVAHFGLEGVPFIINPKFLNAANPDKLQLPTIKVRTMQQLLKDYDYSFAVERQT